MNAIFAIILAILAVVARNDLVSLVQTFPIEAIVGACSAAVVLVIALINRIFVA